MAICPKYYKIHTDGHTVELEPIYEDLVPVVLCKDCRYCSQDDIFGHCWCNRNLGIYKVKADDFCSYGKKDGDGK